jgi:anti-sigma factor RsiW
MPICLEIITEEELHLYTDGQLSADRREAVGDYLLEDDRACQRVEAYRMQIAEMHRWLSPTMEESLPQRLREVVLRACDSCSVGRSEGQAASV